MNKQTGNGKPNIASGPELHLPRLAAQDLTRPAYGGLVDPHGEVRLRIGIIDNPTILRRQDSRINPLDSKSIINMDTGNICIRWIEQQGGLIRPPEYSSGGGDEFSDREMVSLTHPILWANDENWMGLNYMPPVGSIVIVGFRKNNLPILLGFMQSHYQICDPLELGEIMIKGYGNNRSHWKQKHEQEHTAESQDKKTKLKLKISGESKSIVATASNDSSTSTLTITPNSITSSSAEGGSSSTVVITPGNVNVTTPSFNVLSDKISLTSKGAIGITSTGATSITASGNVDVKGSKINLN